MNRIAILFTLVVAATDASADVNLATVSTERPHVLRLRTGLDHALTAEVGYDHVLRVSDRLVLVGAELAMPWARPDLGDLELRIGATLPVLERGAWKLSAGLAPTVRTADTVVSRMTALGADVHLAGGYYRRRGFVAVEAGFDWAAATHIEHHDAYRMLVYPDAKDGWYRSTGGTFRAGLQGGVSFSNVDVVLRVGRPFAIDLEPQRIPFYALLGLNVAR